jgi:hypothetical protein
MHEQINRQFHEEMEPLEYVEARVIDKYFEQGRPLDQAIIDTHLELSKDEDYSSELGYEAVRAAKRWGTYRRLLIEHAVSYMAKGFADDGGGDIDYINLMLESSDSFDVLIEAGDDTVIGTFEKLENEREWHERKDLIYDQPLFREGQAAIDTAKTILDRIVLPLGAVTMQRSVNFSFTSPEDGGHTYIYRGIDDESIGYAVISFERSEEALLSEQAILLEIADGQKEASEITTKGIKQANSITLLTSISALYMRWQESQWSTISHRRS